MLAAAHALDKVGNKAARHQIAAAKVVPHLALSCSCHKKRVSSLLIA